jgi:hypothetical protein
MFHPKMPKRDSFLSFFNRLLGYYHWAEARTAMKTNGLSASTFTNGSRFEHLDNARARELGRVYIVSNKFNR